MADRLSKMILVHWQLYHPKMVLRLQRENKLEQALEETADQFNDLLYELIAVRKMEYHQAWELAIDQMLLPEESTSTSSPRTSHPAISGSLMPTG
jgi:hypothetical protein